MTRKLPIILVLASSIGCQKPQSPEAEGLWSSTELAKTITETTKPEQLQTIAKDVLARNKDLHRYLESQEFFLGITILLFSLLLVISIVILFKSGSLQETTFYRLFLLSLVVTSSLFLIVSGFDQNQITPVIGLLGTITGYVLGRNQAIPAPGQANSSPDHH